MCLRALLLFSILILQFYVLCVDGSINWTKVGHKSIDPGQLINWKLYNNSFPQERITNGSLAKPTQLPYQVGLLLYSDQGRFWCGGTLISNRWVLTAAHCAAGVNGVDIYVGATNRTDPSESGQQIIYVSKRGIYVHEEYDASTISNDIALLKFPVELQFNDFIKPAKLPRITAEPAPTYVGERAIASGWGRTSDTDPTVTDVLRYIDVPIIENSECNRYYLGVVKDSNICISSKADKKSTCNGDSGGPLVLVDNNGNDTLIGATSFGVIFGCEVGFPAAFTRITSYLVWIEKISGLCYR